MDSKTSPINIQKFVSPTPPSESLLRKKRRKEKRSLVWLSQEFLQQDECGLNAAPLQNSQSVKSKV